MSCIYLSIKHTQLLTRSAEPSKIHPSLCNIFLLQKSELRSGWSSAARIKAQWPVGMSFHVFSAMTIGYQVFWQNELKHLLACELRGHCVDNDVNSFKNPKRDQSGFCSLSYLIECTPCVDGWVLFQSKCYLFSADKYSFYWMKWEESRKKCRAMNADLVVIDSQDEQVWFCNNKPFTIRREQNSTSV